MPQKVVKSIKKLKSKNLYLVTIDDEDYKVTDDLIVKYALSKDKKINDFTYDEFIKDVGLDYYYIKVCNYISYQFRSENEIRDYLKSSGCSEEGIEALITKLKNVSLIDDKMLSQFILNSMINNLKGPKAYANKLFERKVLAQANYDKDIEIEGLEKSIEKNKDKYAKYPPKKQKNCLIQKLLRDGFSENLVFKEVSKLKFIDNSYETLQRDYEKLLRRYQDLDKSERKRKIITSLLNKGYAYSEVNKFDFE